MKKHITLTLLDGKKQEFQEDLIAGIGENDFPEGTVHYIMYAGKRVEVKEGYEEIKKLREIK